MQTYQVTHTDRTTATVTDISGAVDISSQEGIETTTDTFEIRLNETSLPSITLKIEDIIKIYFGTDKINTLVMDGFINEISYETSERGNWYLIRGVNKLEALLDNIIPTAYSATDTEAPDGIGWRAGDIIVDLVNQVNDLNGGGAADEDPKKTNWADIGTAEISTTTKHIDFYRLDKTVFQQIEELSMDEFTDNEAYIYYLDSSNNLVWKPRPDNTSPTGTISEGTRNILGIKIQKMVWEAVNALIILAGNDLNDHRIHTMVYNPTSIGTLGWKWKYVAKTDFAKNFISTHPTATNTEVREGVRGWARAWGEDVVKLLGGPRYKATITMKGSTSYIKGDVWTLEMLKYVFSDGTNTYNLRLREIRHGFNAQAGWITTLVLEEDEDTAIENL